MNVPLKDEVMEKLPWLFQDLDFRVVHHEYEPRTMGCSLVELQSDSLRLRFVRERFGVQAELASLAEPEKWWDLKYLWYVISGERPEPELQGLAWFVRDNLAALNEALGPKFQQTKQEFERREEEGRRSVERHRPAGFHGRPAELKLTGVPRLLLQALPWILLAFVLLWGFLRNR